MIITKLHVSKIIVLLLALQILALPLVNAMEMHKCSFSGKIKFSLGVSNNCCFKTLKPKNSDSKTTLERKSCCEKQQIATASDLNIKTEQKKIDFNLNLNYVENLNGTFSFNEIIVSNDKIHSSLGLLLKPKSLFLILQNFRI